MAPLVVLFSIHRYNFSSFDQSDQILLCEITFEDTASTVSSVMDADKFNEALLTSKSLQRPSEFWVEGNTSYSDSSSSGESDDENIKIPGAFSKKKKSLKLDLESPSASASKSRAAPATFGTAGTR